MKRRALVVGSQTGGLSGVDRDVASISEALESFGFEIQRCTGPDASREGILNCYQELISNCQTDDAAVVFFSGHGGYAPNPAYVPMDSTGFTRPDAYQFIVPFDFEESTDADFRGILDVELSALLRALTEKTQNATMILDCCHAARMSRDADMTPRALPRPWLVGVSAHLQLLRERGLRVDRLPGEGNADAVRVVACGPYQSAYEYMTASGERMGLLTESLILALEESRGLRVSWASAIERIRKRVLDLAPTQRPEVEGAASRVLFALDSIQETGILPFQPDNVLLGGRLLGVEIGDQYLIVPPGVSAPDTRHAIASATVTGVVGARAYVNVAFLTANTRIPETSRAIPVRKALPCALVAVEGSGPARESVRSAINASSYVHVAEAMPGDKADILARVGVDGSLTVTDVADNPLAYARPADEQGIRETVDNLVAHARARLLRALRSGDGPNYLDASFDVEWGRVDAGQPRPLSKSGELLFTGDPVYIRFANHASASLYFSLFDIGVSGRIELITNTEPSGVHVPAGSEHVVGVDRATGRVVGLPLSWPTSVPPQGQHTETLLTIISNRPQNLRALEQGGVRRDAAGQSDLQRLMQQIGYGGTRELASVAAVESDVKYAVDQITFLLNPAAVPASDTARFLIDDRPDVSWIYQTARSARRRHMTLDIRITDLIVYRNRVLFGSRFGGDVRLDVMVVTAPARDSNSATYQPGTQHFSSIRDGDPLPLSNLIIFHGPVSEFVDIGVWLSRDEKDAPDLAALFGRELNSAEFKQAALVLGGLALSAPEAAAVVGAIGAGATITNIAARLLKAALGQSIGLYRTSLLPQEGFGVGRHPTNGVMRAQDFSFAFEVLEA